MKEFLNPLKDGGYEFSYCPKCNDSIEVPKGADFLANILGDEVFYKKGNPFTWWNGDKWIHCVDSVNKETLSYIVWQRSETEYLMKGKNGERLMESVGQLKGVEATLAQRQSEYGSFEDVALVTENIMSILAKVRVNGLQDLPNTHRMALYMIASKMARIVNGDFNKLDSWHDIGGYAKLIENLIEGE